MKQLIMVMAALLYAEIAWSAFTTHLRVDCRTGVRDIMGDGDQLFYDASWFTDGVWVRITDNGKELVAGGRGPYAWVPASAGQHLLALSVTDARGQEIASEIAEFSVSPISHIDYENLKGAVHENPATYEMGMPITFTPPEGVPGYTFVGWSPTGITPEMTGRQTVRANWRAHGYRIVYDINGGEGTFDGKSCTYDEDFVLPKDYSSWLGYRLVGWSLDAAARPESAPYRGGETVRNLTAEDGATVTLYAVWDHSGSRALLKSFRQRYPWNGLVDIESEVQAEPGDALKLGLEVVDGKSQKELSARTLWVRGGDVTNRLVSVESGLNRLVWNADADLPSGTRLQDLRVRLVLAVEVSFDAAGGTCNEKRRDVVIGQPFGKMPVPVRSGYRFGGWKAESRQGEIVDAGSLGDSEIRVLKAIWEVK